MIKRKPSAELLAPLANAIDLLLCAQRAERWGKLLKHGRRIEKLSPFEFYNDAYRAKRVRWLAPKGWPDFEAAVSVYFSCKYIGIQWENQRKIWFIDGVFVDFIEFLSTCRSDFWLLIPEKHVSLAITHEENYAIMNYSKRGPL